MIRRLFLNCPHSTRRSKMSNMFHKSIAKTKSAFLIQAYVRATLEAKKKSIKLARAFTCSAQQAVHLNPLVSTARRRNDQEGASERPHNVRIYRHLKHLSIFWLKKRLFGNFELVILPLRPPREREREREQKHQSTACMLFLDRSNQTKGDGLEEVLRESDVEIEKA